MTALNYIKKLQMTLLKWLFLLVMGGMIFYAVFPKYHFNLAEGNTIRTNTITGKVEFLKLPFDGKGEWVDLADLNSNRR